MSIEILDYDDWSAKKNSERLAHYQAQGVLISTRGWDKQYTRYLRQQRKKQIAFARLKHELEETIYKRTHQIRKVSSTLHMTEGEVKALLAQLWGEEE